MMASQAQKDYYYYRFFEILPGFLTWSTILGVIIISILWPIAAIYIVIAFDVYWILRVTYLLIFMLASWFKYRKDIKVDWWSLLKREHSNWEEYYHFIFLPTAGEPLSVVDNTFHNLSTMAYDQKKMVVILAGEERFKDSFNEISDYIQKKYENIFHHIIITLHPANLSGEIAGKGSNLYHAGHEAKRYVDEQGFDYKKIIVSTFDIDTVPHHDYFAYLTKKFLTVPNPYRCSYQPMAFYNNNVWESDIVTRVVANSTTFWLLTDLARPDRLFTFSSHSMSWQALVDIGFWQNNIVTEDSRIFLQCFIHYNGDYQTIPMHIPVSMNTVYMGNFWRSMINQYKQMRRWAWGVEHFPYMVWQFKRHPQIPRSKRIKYLWNQTEGVYSWATSPLIILIMGRLPLYVAEQRNMSDALTQYAPLVLQWIMSFGMIGLLAIALMSVIILPPISKKTKNKFLDLPKYALMFLQWAIFPVTMIVFGALPAVAAQTHLMFGHYLGFWVTEKRK